MSDFLSRVASAPISWGICEVPGWGARLSTERVLGEMAALGMPATELGAPGFLPSDPGLLREQLGDFGMSLIGGFTPLVLHEPSQRDSVLQEARRVAELFQQAGATTFVSAVVMDADWSIPRALDNVEHQHPTWQSKQREQQQQQQRQ